MADTMTLKNIFESESALARFPLKTDEYWRFSPLRKLSLYKVPGISDNSGFSLKDGSGAELASEDKASLEVTQDSPFFEKNKQNRSVYSLVNDDYSFSATGNIFFNHIDFEVSGDVFIDFSELSVSEFQSLNVNFLVSAKSNLSILISDCDQINSNFIRNFNFELSEDSKTEVFLLNKNTQYSRAEFTVNHKEERSQIILNGISFSDADSDMDYQSKVWHKASNTTTNQVFKTISKSGGSNIFQGQVNVLKGAADCEAHQLNQNLTFDKSSKAFSQPELNVSCDEVTASHGSSTGQIDEDQVLYLMTRGFSKEHAEKLILSGFFKDVINLIQSAKLKEKVESVYKKHFGEAV